MKAFLMYKDSDFDLERESIANEPVITQDLELNTLFDAMALEDRFLFEVSRKAVLASLGDPESILYRQAILKDCLRNSDVIRRIYDIALEAILEERKNSWGFFSGYPSSILYGAVRKLEGFVAHLNTLRNIADEHAGKFESEGFTAFFSMLKAELGDDFFADVRNHLRELKFRDGTLISAELGIGNKGINYMLRKSREKRQSWIRRVFAAKPPVYAYRIPNRDENGARALSELKDRGLDLAANALARSSDHIVSFFKMLRVELGFYVGCLNLHGQLAGMGGPVCFPDPVDSDERRHSFHGLYDVCLALTLGHEIVGNDLDATDKDLAVITGANQGGKSTFLRSIGLSQLMMQCGMFTPARTFSANICNGLFTHYRREEDLSMKSGKLDEELARMSEIADSLGAGCLVLFNESFAATNEREGSEIARQIMRALIEKRVKVFFVTHLYDFAHSLHAGAMKNTIFLRAERQSDGGRTFRIVEGEPLQTSYGEDLYSKMFGTDNQGDRDDYALSAVAGH